MQAYDSPEQWVPVPEFRTYFAMNEHSSPVIFGFFRRLYHAPFFTYSYRMTGIENKVVITPNTDNQALFYRTQTTCR
jgi:hypothetical protein